MSGTKDVLKTLSDLSARDRAWVIDNLPVTARVRLLALSHKPHQAELSAPATATKPVVRPELPQPADCRLLQGLEVAEARVLARVLEREPAWITAALLSVREWTWRAELLRLLPPATRLDVESMIRAKRSFTCRMTEALVTRVAARIASPPPSRADSKSATLLDRLTTARSKTRWSVAP